MQFILINILSVLSLLSVIILWKDNILLTEFLVVILILMLSMQRSKKEIILVVFFGIAGSIAEIVTMYFGVWQYDNPSFFGIPLWLPALWAVASIYVIRVSSYFNNKL